MSVLIIKITAAASVPCLSIYSKTIEPFNFIATNTYKNKWYEILYFAGSLFKMILFIAKEQGDQHCSYPRS